MPIRSRCIPSRRSVASDLAFLGFELVGQGGNLTAWCRPVADLPRFEDRIVCLDNDAAVAPTRLDDPALIMRVDLQAEEDGIGNAAYSLHRSYRTTRDLIARLTVQEDRLDPLSAERLATEDREAASDYLARGGF